MATIEAHQSDPADDRATVRWLRGMIVSSVLFALATWQLAEATAQGRRYSIVVWGLALVLVVTVQTFVMKRFRVRQRAQGWRWRAWWQGQQLLVGAVLLGGWGTGAARAGLGFAGLLSAFLAISWAVSEIREARKRTHEQFGYWLAAAVMLGALGAFAPGVPERLAVASMITGAIAAYIAIVTGAQAVFRSSRTPGHSAEPERRATRLRVPVGGVAFLVPTFVLSTSSGWWGFALAFAVLVVVTLGVSRSEWNPVIFVAALVLIPALVPTPTPTTELPSAEPGPESMFVVFGDSYISGEGARTFYAGTNRADDNQCRRAPTAWPVRLAKESAGTFPAELLFFACSGAKARELWWVDQPAVGDDWQEWSHEGEGQLAQFRAAMADLDNRESARAPDRTAGKPIAFALVSIGGNDAGFSTIAKTCLAPGDCTDVARQWVAALVGRREFAVVPPGRHQGDGSPPPAPSADDEPATLQAEIERAYDQIRATLGDDVPIVAVPYPHPVQASGCASTLLSDAEHAFIEAFVDDLNDVVHAAAAARGVYYLDTMPGALDGHRLCETSGPTGVNFLQFSPINGAFEDIVLPVNAIHGSLHPNPTGHDRMAAAARAWFARTDLSRPPTTERLSRTTPAAASLVSPSPPDSCPATGADDPAAPAFRCDAGAWAIRQLLRSMASSALLGFLLVGGAWLLAWEIISRLQAWRVDGEAGTDFDYAPSPPEHWVLWILDRRPLRWIHGGVDPRQD